jgi:DNA-binding transcriptional LysR family regulator
MVEPLPHLDTFLRAAELGGFTAAARDLGLTQAAVSQHIQQLEGSLRLSLFDRRGGRVSLSDAGQRLYAFAQRILALHAEAREAIARQPEAVTGELVLAASSIPGEHLVPRFLAAFRDRYPQVGVRVAMADTAAVVRQVERGHAHLGFVGGLSEGSRLEFTPIARDHLVLVTPPQHPLHRRRRVSVAELLELPLIQREGGSGSRRCLEQVLERAGHPASGLKVVLELGSNEAIKEAVQRGLGLAVLSRLAVEQDMAAGRLHALEVRGLPLERDIFAVRDPRRPLPAAARLFWEMVASPHKRGL